MKHSQSKRFIFVPLNSSQPLRKGLEPTIESINYQQFKTIMSNLSVLKTLVLASAALIGLTSCEKDKALTVDDVTGTYSGQMTVSVGDTPAEPTNDEIIISKVSDNAVSLKIEDFSFMTFNVGDVTLSNCTLTPAGEDSFTLSGSETLTFSLGSVMNQSVSITAKVTITSGTIDASTVSLDISIAAELMGMPMDVTVEFEGTKPAAE